MAKRPDPEALRARILKLNKEGQSLETIAKTLAADGVKGRTGGPMSKMGVRYHLEAAKTERVAAKAKDSPPAPKPTQTVARVRTPTAEEDGMAVDITRELLGLRKVPLAERKAIAKALLA